MSSLHHKKPANNKPWPASTTANANWPQKIELRTSRFKPTAATVSTAPQISIDFIESINPAVPKKKAKKKKAVKAPTKSTRAKKNVRQKVVWGVFNNSNQQLAVYPFPQEGEARAHAERLTADKKTNHFVQKVKVPLEEK